MNRRLTAVVGAILVGTMLLSGCSSGRSAPVTNKAQAQAKPPLQIPASFPNDEAKKDFAIKAVDEGYYQEAEHLLREALATSPDGRTYANLGTALYQLNNFTDAVDAMAKAAQLDPARTGEMKNNMGNALRDAGKIDEAKASYKEALEAEPTRWTAAVNLATILHTEGKVEDAVKLLEATLPANKNAAPVQTLLEAYKSETKTVKKG